MMNKYILILSLLILMVWPLAAQDLTVEYLEGLVEVSGASGWDELFIGDVVSARDTIRVSENGFAELSGGSLQVKVNEDGTYPVNDLISASNEVASWNLGNLVAGKIKTALSEAGAHTRQTAVMGVRGARAGSEGEIEWMEEDGTNELFKQGRELYDQGDYAEAVLTFQEALEEADAPEADLYVYYIAQSYLQMGKAAQALKVLAAAAIDPRSAMFTDLVLLRGELLMESLAFKEALGLFDDYLKHYPEGSSAQAILILSSFCYRGLGEVAQAKTSLDRAAGLNPDSELGKEAKNLKGQL